MLEKLFLKSSYSLVVEPIGVVLTKSPSATTVVSLSPLLVVLTVVVTVTGSLVSTGSAVPIGVVLTKSPSATIVVTLLPVLVVLTVVVTSAAS